MLLILLSNSHGSYQEVNTYWHKYFKRISDFGWSFSYFMFSSIFLSSCFCSLDWYKERKGGKKWEKKRGSREKPHSPGSRRTVYADIKQLTAAPLWCVDFTASPTGRPLASSPRAAALTFLRHLGRPLRAANTDPRELCFSMQPALWAQSAAALTVISSLLSLCLNCHF